MNTLLTVSRWIDRVNERIGRFACWLTLFMVLLGAFNAVARYVGRFLGVRLASNAYLETQWYLFSLVILLGAAFTLRHNAHVRVDVFYERLGARGQAWLNIAGALFLLIPFSALMIWASWGSVINSWLDLEISPDPGGLPRYPIKTMIPLAFLLLILQGCSEIIKQAAFLRTGRSVESTNGGRQDV